MAALVVIKARSVWTALGIYGYILGFPLVLLFWKLPRAVYKSRSGVVFLACANVLVSAVTSLRRYVIEFAVFAFAALGTVLGRSPATAGVASVCLAVILLEGLYRSVKNSLLPARFVRTQRTAIGKVVRSPVLANMLTPSQALLSSDLKRFDAVQQRAFARGLWMAVLVDRCVVLWARELERYGRSRMTIVLNAASYLWLLVRSVSLLALVNWGMYHAQADAFTHTTPPSFFSMLRYTIARLYGGQIDGISPASTVAKVVSVGTLVVGLAVLLGFMLSVGLSMRATRDESEIEGLVAGVHAESERIDLNFRSAYGVSANEAIRRLERLEEDTAGLLAGLAMRIPAESEDVTVQEV